MKCNNSKIVILFCEGKCIEQYFALMFSNYYKNHNNLFSDKGLNTIVFSVAPVNHCLMSNDQSRDMYVVKKDFNGVSYEIKLSNIYTLKSKYTEEGLSPINFDKLLSADFYVYIFKKDFNDNDVNWMDSLFFLSRLFGSGDSYTASGIFADRVNEDNLRFLMADFNLYGTADDWKINKDDVSRYLNKFIYENERYNENLQQQIKEGKCNEEEMKRILFPERVLNALRGCLPFSDTIYKYPYYNTTLIQELLKQKKIQIKD